MVPYKLSRWIPAFAGMTILETPEEGNAVIGIIIMFNYS